jgi:Flp pilus assembly protein TadD
MDPNEAERLLERAIRLDREGRAEEAKGAYEACLQLQPGNASLWADYGGLLMVMGRIPEAEAACGKALELDPGYAPARVNLAHVFLQAGRLEEAESCCRSVLAREPSHLDALIALGEVYQHQGRWDRARSAFEHAATLDPVYAQSRERLNRVYFMQQDHAALRASLRAPLPANAHPERVFERATWELLYGQMPQGWADYERRLDIPGRVLPLGYPRPDSPAWTGESFVGKTLLVHWEQGFGDTLMLLRFLPLVKARGGRVVLRVQRALLEVAATCAGLDEVHPAEGPIPPHDLHVFLMSLPRVFGITEATLPSEVPYLRVPEGPTHQEALAQRLLAGGDRLRIGLVWGGNAARARDAERSLPAEVLNPLAAIPDIAWYSLQVGRPDRPDLPGLVALEPLLETFADTAFALQSLDLLITVDTSVAHLAGAMGLPVFLLLSFLPDWRWLLERDDSPWYPTFRLYRQPAWGDWAAVLRRVVEDLQAGTER